MKKSSRQSNKTKDHPKTNSNSDLSQIIIIDEKNSKDNDSDTSTIQEQEMNNGGADAKKINRNKKTVSQKKSNKFESYFYEYDSIKNIFWDTIVKDYYFDICWSDGSITNEYYKGSGIDFKILEKFACQESKSLESIKNLSRYHSKEIEFDSHFTYESIEAIVENPINKDDILFKILWKDDSSTDEPISSILTRVAILDIAKLCDRENYQNKRHYLNLIIIEFNSSYPNNAIDQTEKNYLINNISNIGLKQGNTDTQALIESIKASKKSKEIIRRRIKKLNNEKEADFNNCLLSFIERYSNIKISQRRARILNGKKDIFEKMNYLKVHYDIRMDIKNRFIYTKYHDKYLKRHNNLIIAYKKNLMEYFHIDFSSNVKFTIGDEIIVLDIQK